MSIRSKTIISETDELRKISILVGKLPYTLAHKIANSEKPISITDEFLRLEETYISDAKTYLFKEWDDPNKLFSLLNEECRVKTDLILTSIDSLDRVSLLAVIFCLSKSPTAAVDEILQVDTRSIATIKKHIKNKINLESIDNIITATTLKIINLDSACASIALTKINDFDVIFDMAKCELTKIEHLQIFLTAYPGNPRLNEIRKRFNQEYKKALKEYERIRKIIYQEGDGISDNIAQLLIEYNIGLTLSAVTAICLSPDKGKIIARINKDRKTEQKREYRQKEYKDYKQITVEIQYVTLDYIVKCKHQSITKLMTYMYEKFINTTASQRKRMNFRSHPVDDAITCKPAEKLKSRNFKITHRLNNKLERACKDLGITFKELSCKLIHEEHKVIQAHLDQMKISQLPSDLRITQNPATQEWAEKQSHPEVNPNRFNRGE